MTLAEMREFDYGAMAFQLACRRQPRRHRPARRSTTWSPLVLDWNRPVKIFIETKHPVRYGALVESKVLALLHRYGIASPASADLSRAVVISFSAAAVWRIRRAAPMLPTVLLGDTSRYLGGGAATTVGATAVGPSIATLREHPELVDRAAAQGGRCTAGPSTTTRTCATAATSVWRGWRRTTRAAPRSWLQNGLTGAGRDQPKANG